MPCTSGHAEYVWRLNGDLVKEGHDIASVMLAYTLSPQGVFPTQLKQAVEILKHLIEVEGKDPANVCETCDVSRGSKLTLC